MLAGLVSSALLAAGLVVAGGAAPAAAATAATDPTYNVVDRPDAGVTADALPTVQIDGVVWDTAIAGDTVYAGGQFANARPAGSAAGTNQTPRSNLLSFNIRTGVMDAGFAPTVNGRIRAMALSPDKSRLYIAGAFTEVNGKTRSRVAAFNTADGSLVSTFAPTMGSDVFSVVVTKSAVYLGGWFTSANGVARNRLAAVDPTTGATLGWAPTADSTVNTMALSPDGTRVIVGGIFSKLNGATAPGIGSIDAANGSSYPFAVNQTVQNYGNSAGIYSVKTDSTNVYASAYWFGGTGNFEGQLVADPYTGAIKSMADCHGDTYDSTVSNGILYTVSHHHDCSNINAFPDTNPRNRWKRANAFTLDATTTVGHNTAGGYYDFYGQPAPSVINWFPDVAAGSYTGQAQGGWTTESTNEYVVEGGEFPSVNNVAQQGLVRFAIPSLATNKQGPRVSATDSAPKLRGLSGTSVRVSWPSNWDRDDMSLTYKLYRSDKGSAPVFTQTKPAEFWNLPTQVFTDTGLTPGATYGYYVTATDPKGNTLKSATTTITTGTDVVDQSAYAQAVVNDGANHYWRLDEKAGQTVSTDWAGGNDLLLGSGVANGTAGAVNGSPDTAATFDGTANGTAGQTSSEVAPQVFSAEAWFKTTSTSGGKILGFGDSQLGNSGGYDRHVYLDNAGHLTFGVYPGSVRSVTSGGTYNDGAWHQVVVSLSDGGMKLYVDGLLEGADQGTTSGQAFNGYWRVGGDNLGGWPSTGSSQNVAGAIDDVSTYPTALTAAQVRNHYTSTGRTLNLPSSPDDAYGQKVYADNPTLFWRLNEQPGSTTVADSSQGRTPGVASNGVTFGAATTVAPGTAGAFDGNDDTLASSRQFTNPRSYSEEVWFNTTTTRGGKLIGFGDLQSGGSNNYDRHVYMENSGQLTFGVWTGQTNLVTSPKSYNDGAWHQMVATQNTTDGMKLYVDGALVGTNGQTDAQSYTGYWRVGGDTAWGGDSSFFNGRLDEAAVYPYALSLTQVQSHYFASDASANAAPTAAFTSSCTQLACYFDGSGSSDPDGTVASWAWDFGDGKTATGATAPHDYMDAGTYTVKLTVTDNNGKSTSTSQPVLVTAPPPNQAPVAAFTSSCTERACAFDSTTSSDPDGTVSGWAWDFGDGSVSTDQNPNHTYATNGTFTVSLTVSDDLGASNKVTHTVTVSATNAAPVAKISTKVTDLSVAVDGSGSSDADGTVASYGWDYGDGKTGSGKTDSHTYAAAGTYTVTLTVTDDQGATGSVTASVTVTAPPADSSVVAADGFGRTGSRWGTADTGGAWTDSGASFFSTDGSKGVITTKSGSGPVASLNSVSVLDSSTTVQFSLDKLPNGTSSGGYYFTLGSRKQGTSMYRLKTRVTPAGGVQLITYEVVSGTETTLKTQTISGLTYTPGDVLNMRFDISGTGTTTLAGKVWRAGTQEPASAQLTGTSTRSELQSAGSPEVKGYLASSSTAVPVASVDNYKVTSGTTTTPPVANVKPVAKISTKVTDLSVAVDGSGSSDADGTVASYGWDYGDGKTGSGKTDSHTYAAAGTYTVTLTVTDDQGATGSVTASVTVTAPPADSSVVAADGFGRTGSRWGTADTGGAWTDSGASFFSTDGSKGVITTKSGSGPVASLNSVSVLDSSTTVQFSLDKLPNGTSSGGYYFTLGSRKQGTSMYRLKTRVTPAGGVQLITYEVVSGTETTLKTQTISGLTYTPGDVLNMRFDISGTGTTTLAGKVWRAGTQEPASAQLTGTSTRSELQSAGSPEVKGYLASSSTAVPVASVDNYKVTRN
ncbi:PKD domain-containing protein [Microlunatus sagamiharensis]|uniref:PKD domain-containing protein n=1 Tax=Microlunatus sagamiharensis TaxID=546874 RepID=UPI0018D3CC28|nr:PKD domain-containing protein [Microlunatus sagamiharensis]